MVEDDGWSTSYTRGHFGLLRGFEGFRIVSKTQGFESSMLQGLVYRFFLGFGLLLAFRGAVNLSILTAPVISRSKPSPQGSES